MSPIRSLVSVVVLGTVLSWLQRMAFPQGEASLGVLIEVFVWQTAVILAVATIVVLSITLPRRLERSNYQHVVFALYECTFVSLVVWALALAVVSTAYWPAWLAGVGGVTAPLILPSASIAIIAHATWHMRTAYGVSWIGAALRVVAIGIIALLAGGVVSIILTLSGVSELWTPKGPAVIPTFQRE